MFDDEVEVDDAEEVRSDSAKSQDNGNNYPMENMEMHAELMPKMERPQSASKSSRLMSSARISQGGPMPSRSGSFAKNDDERSQDNSDLSENSDEDDVQAAALEGTYDPKDYEHLNVSGDVKELFRYITYYTPRIMELDHKLQPFVPDYIPAVGDIDAFIKVARPDGVHDQLGIVVLDEPCIAQSEPAVMHLRLRAATKLSSAKTVVIKKLQNADKNPKAIEKWIQDIGELHKAKPAPTIQYSRPMPDIDSLMQEWPPQFEHKLNEVGLPLEDLEVDLLTYVDIICALLDIPRYESRIESLHVLFSLYSAVKNHKNTTESHTEESNSNDVHQ